MSKVAALPTATSRAEPLANIEAEAALLGAVLIDNTLIGSAAAILQPEDFFEPVHGRIFAAIQREARLGKPTSAVLLAPEFRGDEALKELGGVGYFARLTGDGQGFLAPQALAEQIHELAQRRQRLEWLTAEARACSDTAQPLGDLAFPAELNRQSRFAPLAYEWAGDVTPMLDGFWLIDGFLPKSGPATIFGHPGSGKTFLALDIAASVAEGRAWAGRDVAGGPVFYVIAEGLTGFKNRIAAMLDSGRLSRTAPFAYIPTAIDLQSPTGDTPALIATLKHFAARTGSPPALIVIDTLSKTFGAGKENTDDMAAYVANCERIAAEFEAVTLIIHHRPRNGDNERGHTSLRGGVVASVVVEGEAIRTATTVKQKDGQAGERIAFQLNPVALGSNSRGLEVTTCLVEILDNDDAHEGVPCHGARNRLSGQKKIAFEALEMAIALHGQAPPDSIPRENLDRAKVFKVIAAGQAADKLKAEFLATVNAAPDKRPDTASRTARRAINDLKAAGILATWEDWLWLS